MKSVRLIIFFTLLISVFGYLNAGEDGGGAVPYIDKGLKEQTASEKTADNEAGATDSRSSGQKEHNSSFLKKIGISIVNEKIIVDTKKSRDFFIDLGAKIQNSFEKVMQKNDKNRSQEEDTGIKISDERMVIDFNRTKKYINRWVDTIEVLTDELGRTLDESFSK